MQSAPGRSVENRDPPLLQRCGLQDVSLQFARSCCKPCDERYAPSASDYHTVMACEEWEARSSEARQTSGAHICTHWHTGHWHHLAWALWVHGRHEAKLLFMQKLENIDGLTSAALWLQQPAPRIIQARAPPFYAVLLRIVTVSTCQARALATQASMNWR